MCGQPCRDEDGWGSEIVTSVDPFKGLEMECDICQARRWELNPWTSMPHPS